MNEEKAVFSTKVRRTWRKRYPLAIYIPKSARASLHLNTGDKLRVEITKIEPSSYEMNIEHEKRQKELEEKEIPTSRKVFGLRTNEES